MFHFTNVQLLYTGHNYNREYNLLYYFAYQYDVVQGVISKRDESRQRKRPAVEADDDELSHTRKQTDTLKKLNALYNKCLITICY